jgi:hypothetical protein
MNWVAVGNPPGGSEGLGMTTDETYTLILTKGTHLISGAAAATVRSAIEAGEPLVHIDLDPFGNLDPERMTTIAVRHVVALTKNAPAAGGSVAASGSLQNVAAFRGRRAGR